MDSSYSDRSRSRGILPLFNGPNTLELAVFCANVQGGTTQSLIPETLKATWADSLAVVQAVAIIPLARWRKTVFRTAEDNHVFETFTWVAAVAAMTTRAQIFAAVHMSLVHPVMAAAR